MQRLRDLNRHLFRATVIAFTVCVGALVQADAATPQKAKWQVQEIYLAYLGFTNHYSCDGMRDKVAIWIKEVGAHPNSTVRVAGCDQPIGPARSPSVRIILATPVAASSAAANGADAKRSELVAKLQKGKTPFQDGEFDAVSKTATLESKDPPMVGAAGDCELLENFRDQVLKKIDAKVVKDSLSCTPHQGTVGNPSLTVEVLSIG
jgi:hypothetical protein